MDLSGYFESLPSSIRQKLVPVASRKVCEEMRFWRNLMHFDPFTKKSEISKKFQFKREAGAFVI